MFKQLHYFKSWLLLMLCMIVGVGSASAEDTEAVTFSEQYSDKDKPTSYEGTNFTLDFASNGGTAVQYYATGSSLRLYAKNTMTVSSSKTITKIELSFGTGDGSNDITTSEDTYENGTWEGSANEVIFTIGGTKGHRRIASVTVTFDSSTPSSPLASISVDGAETKFHVGDEFTHAQAVVTATYEDESTAEVTANATFSEPDMTIAGDKEVTVSYTEGEVTKTDTYTINVLAPATLDRIELSGSYPTEFTQGDEFSHEGLMVTAWYDDDTSEDVTADATFSEPDMTTAGEQTVTVTYEGKTEEYTITVNAYVQPTEFDLNLNNTLFGTNYSGSVSGITDDNPVTGTLSGVTVTYAGGGNHYINNSQIRFYPNNKLTFEAPSGYNIKSIVFTASSWGITVKVGDETIDSGTKTWEGEATSVTFVGSGSSGNCQLSVASITLEAITPKVLSSITLSGEYPTTFHTGDAFSHEGMTVTANYDDESTKDVTASATFSEPDMTTAGEKTVTVSYTENEVEKTTTYNITVNAPATLESITLSGEYPTNFEQGDDFSSEGIVVTANWSDQTTTNVTSEATFTGYNMSTVGEQTVTVTYGEQTATYTINVANYNVYKKVTSTEDITDGEYLIVYENGSVAFDGSLDTFDRAENTVDVTISNDEIEGNAEIDAAVFTIDTTNGFIQGTSGKYFGVTSYSNGLSTVVTGIENSLSIDNDGNAVIKITIPGDKGGDMILCFNSDSNQKRFRYYKGGSQKAIQLYKKVLPEITLTDDNESNNSAIIAANDGEKVSVTVERTLSPDCYNTLFLPFAMTAEQIKAAFGEGVQVAGFTGMNSETQFGFTNVTAMAANTGYLVKPAAAVNGFTVKGVTITSAASVSPSSDWIMYGSYDTFDNDANEVYYFTTSGTVKKLAADGSIKGLRAFMMKGASEETVQAINSNVNLSYGGGSSEPGQARADFFLFLDGGTTTGINSIENGQIDNDAPAYNLAGQKVGKGYKGIVIINGKKVVK